MGLRHSLLIAFAIAFVAQIEALSTTLDFTSSLRSDPVYSSTKLLRREGDHVPLTEVFSDAEEERFGVKDAAKMLAKGVEMKAKMKFWLRRGITPENTLDKLKVSSDTDKNYKYFSKYFFKYYGKHPTARPSDLPPRSTHEIMMTRVKNWLKNTQTPPQVFTELGLTGTVASARGQPNFEYYELYSKMWGALQAKLSHGQPPLSIIT